MTRIQPSGAHAPPTASPHRPTPRARPTRRPHLLCFSLLPLALTLALAFTACTGTDDSDATPEIPTPTTSLPGAPDTPTPAPAATTTLPTASTASTANALLSPPFTRPEDLAAYTMQRAQEADWAAIEAVTVRDYGVVGWGMPGVGGGLLRVVARDASDAAFDASDWSAQWQGDLAIMLDARSGGHGFTARRMTDGTLLLDPGWCAVQQARVQEEFVTTTPAASRSTEHAGFDIVEMRGVELFELLAALEWRVPCERAAPAQLVTLQFGFHEHADAWRGELRLTEVTWKGPQGAVAAVVPVWLNTTLQHGDLHMAEAQRVYTLTLQPADDDATFDSIALTLHLTLPDGRTAEVDLRVRLRGRTYPAMLQPQR